MTSTPARRPLQAELAAPPARSTLRAGVAMLRIGAAAALASRTALASRAVFFLLAMTILSRLWGMVAAERVASGLVAEIPAQGLLLYVGATEWITLSIPAVHLRLEDDFRHGALEARMLQPQSPLLMRLCEAAGGMLVRMAALGAAGLVGLAFTSHPWPTLSAWPVLLVLCVLGGVLGLLLQAIVGLSSAWLRSSTPVYLTMQKACFLFGGLLAPVTLYPHALEVVAKWSPFAAHLYWPGAAAIAPADALASLAIEAVAFQVLWLVLLGLITSWMWRAALARVVREGL